MSGFKVGFNKWTNEPHWFKGVNKNMFKEEKKMLFFSVPRNSVPVTIVYAL